MESTPAPGPVEADVERYFVDLVTRDRREIFNVPRRVLEASNAVCHAAFYPNPQVGADSIDRSAHNAMTVFAIPAHQRTERIFMMHIIGVLVVSHLEWFKTFSAVAGRALVDTTSTIWDPRRFHTFRNAYVSVFESFGGTRPDSMVFDAPEFLVLFGDMPMSIYSSRYDAAITFKDVYRERLQQRSLGMPATLDDTSSDDADDDAGRFL